MGEGRETNINTWQLPRLKAMLPRPCFYLPLALFVANGGPKGKRQVPAFRKLHEALGEPGRTAGVDTLGSRSQKGPQSGGGGGSSGDFPGRM